MSTCRPEPAAQGHGSNSEQKFHGRNYYYGDSRDGHRHKKNYALSDTINKLKGDIERSSGQAGSSIENSQKNFHIRIDVNRENLTVKIQGNLQSDVDDACDHIRKQIDAGCQSDSSSVSNGHGGSAGAGRTGRRYEFGEQHDYKNKNSNSQFVKSETVPPLIDRAAFNKKLEEAKCAKCPLTKDFYNEKPEVKNVSPDEVERIRYENNNTMASLVFEDKNGNNGIEIPNPIWAFEQCFNANPDLMTAIKKQALAIPSPIQSQAWPILLKRNDLIGISQTDSGKTLSFLLPAMILPDYQGIPRGQHCGSNVLVLAPTREVALQIEFDVKKYPFSYMKTVCVYDGDSRKLQINTLERGAEINISTRGRLNNLIEAKVIDVRSVTFFILEEFDRMLDMGFELQICKVMLDIKFRSPD